MSARKEAPTLNRAPANKLGFGSNTTAKSPPKIQVGGFANKFGNAATKATANNTTAKINTNN